MTGEPVVSDVSSRSSVIPGASDPGGAEWDSIWLIEHHCLFSITATATTQGTETV